MYISRGEIKNMGKAIASGTHESQVAIHKNDAIVVIEMFEFNYKY